jgi:hypothetical protein
MNMATALIDGLSGEKIRWTAASKGFEAQINRLVGDVLLATGFLSYAGPFNQEFRKQLMKNWKKEMTQNHIPFSEVLQLAFASALTLCTENDAIIHKHLLLNRCFRCCFNINCLS